MKLCERCSLADSDTSELERVRGLVFGLGFRVVGNGKLEPH